MLHTLKPILTPVVRKALAPQFDPPTADAILTEALQRYERDRPSLPRQASTSGALVVRLAALTAGLYGALTARGVPEAGARGLTARVTARVYYALARIPGTLAKARSRSRHRRLKLATDLLRAFPFSAPAYEMVDVEADDGAIAFDVRRCPVAEYFHARGLDALCIESWCNLDFALAEQWDATLERSQTIAGGSSHCDFRWHPHRADSRETET